MFRNLTGWHALIVLALVLLLFGAAKLPALAKGVGQSLRILRSELAEPASAPSAPSTDARPPVASAEAARPVPTAGTASADPAPDPAAPSPATTGPATVTAPAGGARSSS